MNDSPPKSLTIDPFAVSKPPNQNQQESSFRRLLNAKQYSPTTPSPPNLPNMRPLELSSRQRMEKIGWRPRMQTRLQSMMNFFRKRSSPRNASELNSGSLEKDRRNYMNSKFSGKSTHSRNFLWIVFFVKKFIEILKSYNIHQKLMRLTDYHYNLISDKAFYENSNGLKAGEKVRITRPFHDLWERTKRNRKIMRQIRAFKNFFMYFTGTLRTLIAKYVKVFSPENNYRIFWDFVVLFFLVLNIFYIPLIVGFQLRNTYFNYDADNILCNIIPNLVFIVDMFINMNTAYYSKGEYITKRKKILKNYFKSYFYIDLFTIGPVILHWVSSSLFWMSEIDTFSLLRLLKIKQLVWKMDECLHLENKSQGLFNFSRLLFVNLFVAHVCGCCWNYIGNYEIAHFINENWIVRNNMLDVPLFSRYVTCFYWSITTMITVGYGDIIAFTDVERVFSIVVMLMSCAVFAYSLNSIGSIFEEMFKKDNEFRSKLLDITYYMRKRNLNKTLQSKIKRYLEYMHEEELYGYQRGTELIQGLSNKLQEEMCEDLYGKILKNLRVFKENKFTDELLRKVALKVQEITFAPGDVIFLEKEFDENRLYFIMKGEIELFQRASINKDNEGYFSNIRVLKSGEYFGEFCFFSGKLREISAKSKHVSTLCYINQCDFLEVCKDFPEDFVQLPQKLNKILKYF